MSKAPDSRFDTSLPISIIICAHNEEANLQKNLPSILNQTYEYQGKKNFEVLVVNDNSQDNTAFLLMDLKKEYPHLNILNLEQESRNVKGKKFPLSMSIKQARHEHLLLTDADCQPTSELWLLRMVQPFYVGKKIVLGFSPYYITKGWLNRQIRYETFYSAMQYLSFALAGVPYMGVGRNLAYVRSLFLQNKGFSSHYHLLSGDDDLFINAVATNKNTAIVISEEAYIFSKAKSNKEAWRFQKKRHFSTGRYYKTNHKFLLALKAFSHFFFFIAFIACLFTSWRYIALLIFAIRWLVIFLIQFFGMKKLRQQDLTRYILFFDVWLLWYYIKNSKNIFFKNNISRWR